MKVKKRKNNIQALQKIENKIYLIRHCRIMLDSDLAKMYGVSTKRLNEQVKRNLDRFPSDFMFLLSTKELENRVGDHAIDIKTLFEAIRQLMNPPQTPRKRIGFKD